jgi:putative colanic acid biosynthesis UDP-glucose lipid carrier transferase
MMGFFERHQFSIQLLRRLLDPLIAALGLPLLCWAYGLPFAQHYVWLAVITGLLVVIAFGGAKVYRPWRSAPLGQEAHFIWIAWVAVCGALFAMGYATRTSELFSRRVLLIWVIATPMVMIGMHLSVRLGLRWLRERGRNFRTAVIVGSGELARRLCSHVASNPWLGIRVIGFVDDRESPREGEAMPIPYLGAIDDLTPRVQALNPNFVYIALPMGAEERIRQVIDGLMDTTASVYLVPNVFTFQLLNARAEEIDGLPLIGLCETPFAGLDGWFKRVEDVLLSALILALISPVLLAIALGVKVTSPGPVLFKQRRYGLDGRRIRVYKFRTMTVCEDDEKVTQASRADARVTRLGAFLRRTSLDELPQFFNVLQGRMSIVGPRPHAITHNEQYRRLIKGYMLRHKVRPGITGLAQVNGFRGETDTLEKMRKRVEYDLNYIRNWSLVLDLKIIALTVLKGFSHKNAY